MQVRIMDFPLILSLMMTETNKGVKQTGNDGFPQVTSNFDLNHNQLINESGGDY